MDATLVGTTGKAYHAMPHERWLAEHLVTRSGKVDSPKGVLRRSGFRTKSNSRLRQWSTQATVITVRRFAAALVGFTTNFDAP